MSKRRRDEQNQPNKKRKVEKNSNNNNASENDEFDFNESFDVEDTVQKLRQKRKKTVEDEKKREIGIEDDVDSEDFVEAGEADPDDLLFREEKEKAGVTLEPFNMNDELRRREIDEKGDYKKKYERRQDRQVLERDVSASEEDEPWLVDHEEKVKNDKEYAKKSKLLENNNVNNKEDEKEDDKPEEKVDLLKLLNEICDYLKWGETVRKASNRIKKDSPDKLTIFMDLTNKAVENAFYEIFSMTKEDILDKIDSMNNNTGNANNTENTDNTDNTYYTDGTYNNTENYNTENYNTDNSYYTDNTYNNTENYNNENTGDYGL